MAESYKARKQQAIQPVDDAPAFDNRKCSAPGCILNASIFPGCHGAGEGMRGVCGFHFTADKSDKDAVDVSTRIRNRLDLVGAYFRMRNAMSLPNDAMRTRAYLPGSESSEWRIIPVAYPFDFPIRDDEHHHDWVDRLGAHLNVEIIAKARRQAQW